MEFPERDDDVNCVCGTEPQTMEHLLRCPLLEQTCNPEDLAEYTDVAKECVQLWQTQYLMCGHDKKKTSANMKRKNYIG